ncbi:MAG: rhodanese-like domain-containing protein [Chlorobiota bacterium]
MKNILTNSKSEEFDLFELLNEKSAVVIDVRSESEYKSGSIKNSVNIPVENIADSLERIKEIQGPIVFCCLSGARSALVVEYLDGLGVSNIYNGGSWKTVEMQLIQK